MSTLTKQAPPELVWDYAAIQDEAPVEVIQAAASQIKLAFRKTVSTIIEIGKCLAVVKKNLPHGRWGDWLDVELGMSSSSAANYLNTYEHRDQFKAVENWSASAAFLLTGPSASSDDLDAGNQLAENGEKVTRQAAKEILANSPPKFELDPDSAETASDTERPAADIDHDVDRTRQAPERDSTTATAEKQELKYAAAVWTAAAKLTALNPGGAAIVLREAEKEATQFAELTLGDDGRPDRATLKSFLDGGRS